MSKKNISALIFNGRRQKAEILSTFVLLVLSLFFTSLLFANSAAEEQQTAGYYSDSKRGYWWYEDPKEEKKEEDKKGDKAAKPQQQRRIPSMKDYTYEQLWNMYPDDFQQLLTDFQKKAVQDPSPENVKDYYVIQDVARRKALAFANVSQYVIQTNPDLNVQKDSPIVTPGRNALYLERKKEIEKAINSAQSDFALLYFHSPTCPFCVEQDSILKFFTDKYRWEMKRLDIDEYASLAADLGVSVTPSLVLIYRNSKDHILVSSGVIALTEMEDKLYRGIKVMKGDIDPQNWSLYEFEKGSTFDVNAPRKKQR